MSSNQQFLQNLYNAFNKREIETIIAVMHPDVKWANGLEGGFVYGRDAVREYWTEQLKNIQPELELGFLILMAFVLKKKRAIHGAFLLSTTLLFMGIAIFFTLLAWVPQFKIEGPETFYRFGTAALTGLVICLFVGIVYVLKNRRNGWPVLLGGSFLLINQLINGLLINFDLIKPLTVFVGSLNETATFATSFVVLLILLIFTGVLKDRQVAPIRSENALERA